jgi:hypothetical protein
MASREFQQRRVDAGEPETRSHDLYAPAYDTEEEALSHLEEVCGEIFQGQLDGWYRVPSSWPVNRDFDMFQRWFEYRFHSMLVDLCEDPLVLDEL